MIECEKGSLIINIIYFSIRGNFLRKKYPENKELIISGKVSFYKSNLSVAHPDYIEEIENEDKLRTFENIYSIESGGLQFISNFLINSKKLETISKKFFNLKSYKNKSTFLYTKVDIKDENSNKIRYLSNLEDLNFLIRNIFKISNEEYLEIISQSLPEKNPILYTETSLKIP